MLLYGTKKAGGPVAVPVASLRPSAFELTRWRVFSSFPTFHPPRMEGGLLPRAGNRWHAHRHPSFNFSKSLSSTSSGFPRFRATPDCLPAPFPFVRLFTAPFAAVTLICLRAFPARFFAAIIRDLEEGYGLLELFRLARKLLGGGRHLFRAEAFCWITWSSCWMALLICSAPVVLLVARGVDLAHEFRRLLDVRDDPREHLPRFLRDLDARGGEPVDLSRGDLASLRELSHLGGDHREALAVLARPGCLDGGVEGEEVRLPGDLFYDRYLVRDLLHGGYGLGYGLAPFLGVLGGLEGDLLRLLGVVRVLLDVRYHLLHGGRDLFRGGRLLGRALGHLLGGGAYLLAARATLSAAVLTSPTTLVSFSTIVRQRPHQLVLGGTLLDAYHQVSFRDLLGGLRDLVHGVDEDVEVVLDGVEVPVVRRP